MIPTTESFTLTSLVASWTTAGACASPAVRLEPPSVVDSVALSVVPRDVVPRDVVPRDVVLESASASRVMLVWLSRRRLAGRR